MARNSNTVNIAEKPYHHGNLRAVLVREGLRLLAERDAETLSLREVARTAGVTATSVYRHFPDKDALMTALAMEGLAQLNQAQQTAAAGCTDGKQSLVAVGRAYIRFALANPALFRLIFTSPLLVGSGKKDVAQSEAWAFLQANASDAIRGALKGPSAKVRALRAWAFVHGIAMLMLDGQLPAREEDIDSLVAIPPG